MLWEVITHFRAVRAVLDARPPIVQKQMIQMQYGKCGRPGHDRPVSSLVERVGVGGKGLLNRGGMARAVEVAKDEICIA